MFSDEINKRYNGENKCFNGCVILGYFSAIIFFPVLIILSVLGLIVKIAIKIFSMCKKYKNDFSKKR